MKIVYIDMDNVLVDFPSGIQRLTEWELKNFEGNLDEVPGIFSRMDPMPGAIEAVTALSKHFDMYILSTAPWKNPSAWIDKVIWVQKYFGQGKDSLFYKRIIISHHKNLNAGDYLVDDRLKNGVEKFTGEHIHFGQEPFKGWPEVVEYLIKNK